MKNRMTRWVAQVLTIVLLLRISATALAETVTLPGCLEVIDEQAFCEATSLSKVVVQEGALEIQSKAFAYSSISEIELPSTLTYIAPDAFEGCWNLKATVPENTYAYTRCEELGLVGPVTYRALLIGNTYPGAHNELKGPDNDVKALKETIRRFTDTPYDITTRNNLNASQIFSNIESVFADADMNDVSLFFYSGHGTISGSLVGTGSTYVTVSQLREALDEIPGTKIVMFDCCYSGNYIDKDEEEIIEGFNDSILCGFTACERANLVSKEYIVLTSCSKKQTSYTVSLSGLVRVWFGAFTYALTRGSGYNMLWGISGRMYADKNGDEKITLREAYDDLTITIRNSLKIDSQSAQYQGPDDYVLWAK